MAFENSLTTGVQNYIRKNLAEKIMQVNSPRNVGRTAREIRDYLTDPTTLVTPDFVIRRHIQAYHPTLLEEFGPLPDLVNSDSNKPWPADVLKKLASRLAALSREQGAVISSTEWGRYLSGKGCKGREKLMQIAFSLKMDVSQTMGLMLAFGMEPYSVRNPLDLICMFCQKLPGTYTWAQADEMLSQFTQRRTGHSTGAEQGTPGMSEVMEQDLNALFDRNLQGSNAQQAMVDYMVAHSGEFISFRNGGEAFLPDGYTAGRSAQYLRLAAYLERLYPSHNNPIPRKYDFRGDRIWDTRPWDYSTEYVVDKKTGELSLPALVRTMFSASGWADLEWEQIPKKGTFEYTMYSFCKNYEQHIDKVSRLYSGGKSIDFFNRRDALLFIFFLISGCLKLIEMGSDTTEYQLEKLREMTAGGSRFDAAVGQVLDVLETLHGGSENVPQYFQSLCRCFNMILTQMGHTNLYLPAQFDRFVLLALLSEDPEELASLIMNDDECEDLITPYTSPVAGKR